jgi:hypothetical protein
VDAVAARDRMMRRSAETTFGITLGPVPLLEFAGGAPDYLEGAGVRAPVPTAPARARARWDSLRKGRCSGALGPAQAAWLDLFWAVGARDAAAARAASDRSLLDTPWMRYLSYLMTLSRKTDAETPARPAGS